MTLGLLLPTCAFQAAGEKKPVLKVPKSMFHHCLEIGMWVATRVLLPLSEDVRRFFDYSVFESSWRKCSGYHLPRWSGWVWPLLLSIC